MNGIERVYRAIEFRAPDRVPFLSVIPALSDIFFITYTPAKTWQPEKGFYPKIHFLIAAAGDWRPRRPLPLGWAFSGKPLQDEFGCVWKTRSAHDLGQVSRHPLKDWSALETFRVPNPRLPERFTTFRRLRNLFGRGLFTIGDLGNGVWERSHFLRGFEEIMMDLVVNTSEVQRLMDRLIEEWYIGLMDMYARCGCHAVIMTDDWGTQRNLMISPETWRRVFKPRYERLIGAAHAGKMKFFLHSCGDIRAIVPDLIEIGLDVLQKDDMECLGLDYLEENVSGKLCLMGPLDLQRVLPRAAPRGIEREVKRTIGAVGKKNGGLIGMIYAQPEAVGIPWYKFALMHYYFHRHGKYPV
ncbi:MAG: uroporphyrinogen decarboxylase family protein [bacterium]